jgi:predicted RecB family nuclease
LSLRVKDRNWALSSRDIWRGAACKHCTDLAMALAVGDTAAMHKVEGHKPDLDNNLAIRQGTDFEKMLLAQLEKNLPAGQLVQFEKFAPVAKTRAAIESRTVAIGQAGLEKLFGHVVLRGYVDLLVRDDYAPGIAEDQTLTLIPSGKNYSGYTVWDIKHNANVKDEHQFQIAGYIQGLKELHALSSHSASGIIIRSKEAVGFESGELLEKFEAASSDLFRYLNERLPQEFELPAGFVYECATSSVCEKVYCEYPSLCEQERYARDDIGQLYSLHHTHRPKLEAAGFDTVASIANAEAKDLEGVIPPEQFLKYQPWAKVINASRADGALKMETLVDPSEFRSLLPAKNEGDLFVDYEWFQPTGEPTELIYMLSATDWDEQFYPFVATSRQEELKAFKDFVGFLLERIEKYPAAHIYHFHNPETKRLEDLSSRYGVLGDEVAKVMERMFDIKKKVVDGRMVNSLGKLGIKQLGKFYLSDHDSAAWPDSDDSVEDGLDSMKFFYDYLAANDSGDLAKAEAIMKNILDYNKADCTATSRLYTWLYNGEF